MIRNLISETPSRMRLKDRASERAASIQSYLSHREGHGHDAVSARRAVQDANVVRQVVEDLGGIGQERGAFLVMCHHA